METLKTSKTERRFGRKWIILGIIAAVVTVGGGTVWVTGPGTARNLLDDLPKATIVRGELVVSITESGEIQAQRKKTIANNLRWSAVIVERVDEGEHVATGDLIIKFECQDLLEAIDRTALEVTTAENDFQRADEQIDLTQKEWINRLAQAHAAVTNAKNDQTKFNEHERTQRMREAKGRLALSQQDLELAQGRLEFKESVNQTAGLEDTYSLSTIKADRLGVKRLSLAAQNAEAEVQKLELYELPREETRLLLALNETELELERTILEDKAQRRLAAVNKSAKLSTLEMKQRRFKDLMAQKEQLEIRAESPGVIIYDSGRHWDPPDLSVGALVQSHNRLMQIPDMSTLRVYSKVFEGVSEKVQLGMPVTVRLDSRADSVLTGTVAHIAQLASSEDRRWNPNVKVFPIEIVLDQMPEEGIKPGSSAQIELILARLPDVLQVEIAAVFTEQERTYVWKVDGSVARRTEVTIGEMSDTRVQILSGIDEGETVLLAPPPAEAADTSVELTPMPIVEAKPATPVAAAPKPTTQPAAVAPAEGRGGGEGGARRGERRRGGR